MTKRNDTPDAHLELYLLHIRGTIKPATVEDARKTHNETAGNPQGVEAARSLGDLSHMAYVTMPLPGQQIVGAGELMFLDVWSSLQGLNTFFSDKQVQEGGGYMFTKREPTVFSRARETLSFDLPAPTGQNDRFIGVIRGTVKSKQLVNEVFDPAIAKNAAKARRLGQLSHNKYWRISQPGEPESLELLGVDVWSSAQGMGQFYADPSHMPEFDKVFVGKPDTSVWMHGAGQWVEW